jgi:arsenate reductase
MELLEQRDVNVKVIRYLETPPSAEELEFLLSKLGMEPRDLMRKGEKPYKDLELKEDTKTRADLIEAMVKNPILIERPIVVNHEKVALGRPLENVLGIL